MIIHNPKQADPPPPHTMTPREIVEKSLGIAGDMCIYTNHNRIIETIE